MLNYYLQLICYTAEYVKQPWFRSLLKDKSSVTVLWLLSKILKKNHKRVSLYVIEISLDLHKL